MKQRYDILFTYTEEFESLVKRWKNGTLIRWGKENKINL